MIPVGVVFLLVIAAVCLQAVVRAHEIERHETDDRIENWNWPERGQ